MTRPPSQRIMPVEYNPGRTLYLHPHHGLGWAVEPGMEQDWKRVYSSAKGRETLLFSFLAGADGYRYEADIFPLDLFPARYHAGSCALPDMDLLDCPDRESRMFAGLARNMAAMPLGAPSLAAVGLFSLAADTGGFRAALAELLANPGLDDLRAPLLSRALRRRRDESLDVVRTLLEQEGLSRRIRDLLERVPEDC